MKYINSFPIFLYSGQEVQNTFTKLQTNLHFSEHFYKSSNKITLPLQIRKQKGNVILFSNL